MNSNSSLLDADYLNQFHIDHFQDTLVPSIEKSHIIVNQIKSSTCKQCVTTKYTTITLETHNKLQYFADDNWGPLCYPCYSYYVEYYKPSLNPKSENVGNNEQKKDEIDRKYEEEEGDLEVEDVELQLSEEVIAMFRHSENYRQERDQQRKRQREMEAEEDERARMTKSEVPTHLEHQINQELLYGHLASDIITLETILETKYHANIGSAVTWPMIPIKIKFNKN